MKIRGWILIAAGLIWMFGRGSALAVSPWPGESHDRAVKLTLVDSEFSKINMSGAMWNPFSRTLWLANNSGRFYALVEDGSGGFVVATNASGAKARWAPGGDLEAICQADYRAETVYLMDENSSIREYDVSRYGVISQTRSWNITAQCPETGGAGPEGMTFVPNEFLEKQGFRDAAGNLYVSTNGMGGLMFVGHQSGGYVHVFDLNRNTGTHAYVGKYKTGRAETAGLEFDRSTGILWVWHNTGANYLEAVELGSDLEGSDRRLRQIIEYTGPRAGNLEGIAIAPTAEADRWCFITDDNNDFGEAVVWYQQFLPEEDADADSMPDDWELSFFGSAAQTTGSADPDGDGMNNLEEYIAGTDPGDSLSFWSIQSAFAGRDEAVLTWPSASGRQYAVYSATNLQQGFNRIEQTVGAAPPVNSFTASVATVCGFYRVDVSLP